MLAVDDQPFGTSMSTWPWRAPNREPPGTCGTLAKQGATVLLRSPRNPLVQKALFLH